MANRRSWLLQVNGGQLNCYLSADGTLGVKNVSTVQQVLFPLIVGITLHTQDRVTP